MKSFTAMFDEAYANRVDLAKKLFPNITSANKFFSVGFVAGFRAAFECLRPLRRELWTHETSRLALAVCEDEQVNALEKMIAYFRQVQGLQVIEGRGGEQEKATAELLEKIQCGEFYEFGL